jgi:hypothetical protein
VIRAIVTLLFALTLRAGETYSYWVEPCTRPETGCRAADPELAGWALEAWQTASDGQLHVTKADKKDDARIRIVWASGADGLYGEAVPIRVHGKTGAEVHVRPDLDQLGPGMASAGRADPLFRETIVYLTCLHETGHAIGLPHTAQFDDIMYSFVFGGDIREYFARYRRTLTVRDDIRKHSGISQADQRRLRASLE